MVRVWSFQATSRDKAGAKAVQNLRETNLQMRSAMFSPIPNLTSPFPVLAWTLRFRV